MLTGTGTVMIVVEDINDHNPEFIQSRYRAEVAENSPVDIQVIKVTAIDNDADINALIRYLRTKRNLVLFAVMTVLTINNHY